MSGRSLAKELTEKEFAALNFDAVRCTGCTPCCMGHTHFLYDKKVLWACQTKLERSKDAAQHARSTR